MKVRQLYNNIIRVFFCIILIQSIAKAIFLLIDEGYDYESLYLRLFTAYPKLTEIKAQYVTHKSLTALKGPYLEVVELEARYEPYEELKGLFTQCPNIVKMTFTNFFGVNDESIIPIVKACPKLERLAIPDFTSLTDKTLECLSSLSNLKELDLLDSREISNEGIVNLIEASPHLEVLRLRYIDDDAILESLGRYCPHFRIVEALPSIESVSGAGVVALACGCPFLEEVSLGDYCPCDQVLSILAESCHHLKRVDFSDYTPMFTDQGLIALSRGCPDLTDLCIPKAAKTTDQVITSFAEHCHKLESVKINQSSLITSASLCQLLASNHSITTVSLANCGSLTDDVLLGISQNCTKLTSLAIHNCKLLTEAPLYAVVSNCTCLVDVRFLCYGDISDALVDTLIHHCKRLKSILLYECPHVTYHSLKALIEYGKSLTSIKICKCSLYDSDELSHYYTVDRQSDSPNTLKVGLYRKGTRLPWVPPKR